MRYLYLGIDTSNYRSSLCVIDQNRQIIFEQKELIPVELGKLGMMQSEALFHHISRIPELFSLLPKGEYTWDAIAASTRPRPIEGSYMPVFRAGESFGRFAATLVQAPFYHTSHQEGHIAAGVYSISNGIPHEEFLAVHLSGGTSELLRVSSHKAGYHIDILGASMDLHAGQLIDRIGVRLGLNFPAGPQLEQLAKQAKGEYKLPSSVRGYDFSFSGPESAAFRAIENGINNAEIAYAVQQVIANSIEKVVRAAVLNTKLKDVLIVGGVASNQFIKNRLKLRLEHPAVNARLYFTSPEYSGDNAFGVANIALNRRKYEH